MAQQTLLQDCLDLLGEVITSGDTAYTTAIFDDIANNGVRYIFMKLPREALMKLSIQETAFIPATGITPDNTQVISVLRNDGTFDRECVEVSQAEFAQAANPLSIYRATALTPVYASHASTAIGMVLKVAPTAAGSVAKLIDVSYPTIANATSKLGAITGFPDELGDALLWYIVGTMLQRESNLSRRTAQDEIESINTSGILTAFDTDLASAETALDLVTTKLAAADISTALTAINTELDKVGAIIVEGSVESDIAVTESATMFGASATGKITAFGTAITDVQTDMDLAVSILGGASPSTNAASDIDVAAAATSPADNDVIQLLNDGKLDKAGVALSLAENRMKEAAGHITAGNGKIQEATAEISDWAAQWTSIVQQLSLSETFFKEANSYVELAKGYAAEVVSLLSHIGGSLQEAAGRVQKATALLTKAGVRLQSATDIESRGKAASEKGREYLSMSDKVVTEYQTNFASGLGKIRLLQGERR